MAQLQTDDFDVVLTRLRALKVENPRLIVAIDGNQGAGKSCLGKRLAAELGGVLLDADDDRYRKARGPYVENTDVVHLARDIAARSGGPVFVASVCVLEVLHRAAVLADYLIYVKAVNQREVWGTFDEHVCSAAIPIDDAIEFIGRGETKPGIRDLAREVARYHRSYDPVKNANIVFIRRTTDT